jgi:Tfp pilus assembly protein PilF
LFTKGLIGKTQLLKVGKPEQAQQDALILAKDYIEYSQLEQAMSTLEQAMEIEPDREDIQLLLLELYQSTRSVERFQNQFHAITQRGALKIEDWQALADVFNEKSV